MNWGDFIYAVALARGGTLSAAARELRVNHVTIARRVARLEVDIGTELFDKTPDGYQLTPAGELVVAEGKSIERRLAELHLQVERFSRPTSGSVRVSALPSFFTEVLIPRLSRFRDRYPDIELTLDESATYVDLSRKQAEIALRSPKPKQPNLVCRRACRVGNAMYASRDYIARFGLPVDLKQANGHFVVRYAEDFDWVPEEKWLDRNVRGVKIAGRATGMLQVLQMVAAGLGFGFIECLSGDADPDLVRIPASPQMSFTYWLTTHEEAYKAPRVRAVLDFLAEVCAEVEVAYRG